MSKILSILLALVVLCTGFAFAEEEVLKIGYSQMRSDESMNAMLEGFIEYFED